jgi:hypothetical protein
MNRTRSFSPVGLLAAAVSLALAAPAPAQIAVVTIRSPQALLADFRYIAPLVNAEPAVAQLDAFLTMHPRLKSLDGVDANRPCGLYVNWPDNERDVTDFKFPVVFFVPVTDEKKFLAIPEELGFAPKRVKEGHYSLTVLGLAQLQLRFAHGHAFIAPKPEWLEAALPNPADFLPSGARDNLLVASLRCEQFPPAAAAHLSNIFEQAQKQINQGLGEDDRRPGETDAEYRRRRVARRNANNFSAAMTQATAGLGQQLREITLRVALDQAAHQVAVELAVVPRAGRPLANMANHVGEARSRFSGLTRKAPVGVFLHIPAAKGGELMPDLEPFSRAARDLVGSRNRELVSKFMQVLIPTIATDGLDCFVTVTPSGPKFEPTVLGGLKVRNGRKLDHLVRDTYRDLSTNEKREVTVEWNHDGHAGARIHRVRFAGGDQDVFVAIRDDVVFVSTGPAALPILHQALDDFDKSTTSATPFVEISGNSALIREQPEAMALVEKLVPAERRDKLFARITLRGGNDWRLRLEFSIDILRLLAELGGKG